MAKDPNWRDRPGAANLVHFKPGVSGNPGGKAVGTRTRLTAHFLNALADDFEEHGKKAIKDAREADPLGYVKVIGALMPRQIEATNPLDDMPDAELLAAIALIRSHLTVDSGTGAGEAPEPSQAH